MPTTEKTTETAKTLAVLKVLYDDLFVTVADVALKTELNEQAARRRLLDMKDVGWVDITRDGATDLFFLTDRSYLDIHNAAIKNIEGKITDFLETLLTNITEKINQFPGEKQ